MTGLAAGVLALGLAACVAPPGVVTATITVDPSVRLGPTNPDLRGFSHTEGDLGLIAGLRPTLVRVDARPQAVFPAPDAFEPSAVLARVAAVRAQGAVPLVILSGTPTWLGVPGSGAPETRPPVDVTQWQGMMERLMETLATAPSSATMFEVWNEPDGPTFWTGDRVEFGRLAVAVHRAAAAVEARTGIDLQVGGAAASFPDAGITSVYLDVVRRAGLVPDFVTWHQYPNVLMGPDGPETPGQPLYDLLAGRNPLLSPQAFADPISRTRAMVRAKFGGDADRIRLGISEWNLSAGGLDLRNETNEGAAFVAAALTVFERAGLDFATGYRSVGSTRPGDWGVVDVDGVRTPRYAVSEAFAAADGERIASRGADPATGLWARATTTPDGATHVFVSAFGANPFTTAARRVTVRGLPAGEVSVAVLGPGDTTFEPVGAALDVAGSASFDLPAQSVARVVVSSPAP